MPARAAKELRTLLLPAGLILAVSALAGVWASPWGRAFYFMAVNIAEASFFIGTPLLAAWSVGAEFQQRTLVLLLTQPVSRSRVWLEKWLALALVAALLLAIQTAVLDIGPFGSKYPPSARLLWIAAMLGSAPLWTLLTKSTIGGLAFSIGAVGFLETAASFIPYWVAPAGTPREMFAQTPLLNVLRVLYPIVTFALGWWTFSRLQVGAFDHGESSPGASARLLPLFRYRRSTLLRNMYITEMRVYRPAWLISLAFSACWLLALAVGASGRISDDAFDVVLTVLLMGYLPLAVVLAGTLSITEDVTLGIHSWHLSLPLATRTQWLVKLVASQVAGLIVIILIPSAMWTLASIAIGTAVIGTSPLAKPDVLFGLAALVVLCFWAATLFGHLVRAAVAASLMLVALGLCASVASRIAYSIEIFDGVLTGLMLRWRVPPDYFFWLFSRRMGVAFKIAIPLVLSTVALVQSLRAFRRVQIGRRSVAAHVAALVAVMVVSVLTFFTCSDAAMRLTRSGPAMELKSAVQAAAHKAPTRGPRRLALEELQATGELSPRTQRWLEGSAMTLEHKGRSRRGDWVYTVRVEFPGQREYEFWVEVPE